MGIRAPGVEFGSYFDVEAAELRAAVLFGFEPLEDPLSIWSNSKARPAFKIVPSQFLRKASRMRPVDPVPTASAFAQWVYSIYGDRSGSEEDVILGKVAEQDIWERRISAAGCNDDRFLKGSGWDWSLIHNGLHLRDRYDSRHFLVPHLSVNEEPLRVSPDLIYAKADRSELMIVEVKFSRQPLPENLWPNVWAQLWCYAQLEIARTAPKLTVVGEVWGERWYGLRRRPQSAVVCLRASVRRDPRAPAYDKFFRRLFGIYAGRSKIGQ